MTKAGRPHADQVTMGEGFWWPDRRPQVARGIGRLAVDGHAQRAVLPAVRALRAARPLRAVALSFGVRGRRGERPFTAERSWGRPLLKDPL